MSTLSSPPTDLHDLPPLDSELLTPLLQSNEFTRLSPTSQIMNTPVLLRTPDVQVYDNSESSPTSDVSALPCNMSIVPATSACDAANTPLIGSSPSMTSTLADSPAAEHQPEGVSHGPIHPSSRALLTSVSLYSLSAFPVSHFQFKPTPLGRSRAMNGVVSPRLPTTSSFLRAKMTPATPWSAVAKGRSSKENKENVRPT